VGCERGRISICDGWARAEWNVAASEVAETLESDLLCQWVLRGCKCWEALDGVAIFTMLDMGDALIDVRIRSRVHFFRA
jgi:hypothetical protein